MEAGVEKKKGLFLKQTFFLEGTDSRSANLEFDLFAVDNNCLSLEVWLPDFIGAAQRKANVLAVLLAFAGEFTFLHRS
jgi:hypothetical protein